MASFEQLDAMAARELRLRPERAGLAARPLIERKLQRRLEGRLEGLDARHRRVEQLGRRAGARSVDCRMPGRGSGRAPRRPPPARARPGSENSGRRWRATRRRPQRPRSPTASRRPASAGLRYRASAGGCGRAGPRSASASSRFLDVRQACQYDTRVSKKCNGRYSRGDRSRSGMTAAPAEDDAKRVYVVGTADTKGDELAFLADAVAAAGVDALRVDIGTRAPTIRGRHSRIRSRRAPSGGRRRRARRRRSRRGGGGDERGLRAFHRDAQRHRRHRRHRRRRRHRNHHRRHAPAAARPAEDHGLDARLRRRRAIRRRLRHRHDAVGDRHGRAQPALARDPVERRAGDRGHGEGPCPGRRRQAGARAHHVRRHHGVRDRDRRQAARRL